MLGASFDSPAENRVFREKFAFPYDLLSDPSRATALAYGAAESPEETYPQRIGYLIDPEGLILVAYPEVDPATHPEQVLADLG